MGHYSDSYEYDEEQSEKRRALIAGDRIKKKLKKLSADDFEFIEELLEELDGIQAVFRLIGKFA